MATKRKKKVVKKKKGLPGKLTGATINGFPIRRVKVKDLDVAPYNPREIRESALAGLKASVDEFGMPQPIVWNRRTQTLVGGHQRLKTLDPNALTDIVEVDLGESKERALNLALNNPHIAGDWTTGLGELLDGLQDQSPELMARLALDDLRVDVPDFSSATAPDEFPEVDEHLETQHACPKCGYAW